MKVLAAHVIMRAVQDIRWYPNGVSQADRNSAISFLKGNEMYEYWLGFLGEGAGWVDREAKRLLKENAASAAT